MPSSAPAHLFGLCADPFNFKHGNPSPLSPFTGPFSSCAIRLWFGKFRILLSNLL